MMVPAHAKIARIAAEPHRLSHASLLDRSGFREASRLTTNNRRIEMGKQTIAQIWSVDGKGTDDGIEPVERKSPFRNPSFCKDSRLIIIPMAANTRGIGTISITDRRTNDLL
jgi:hypothetical protein